MFCNNEQMGARVVSTGSGGTKHTFRLCDFFGFLGGEFFKVFDPRFSSTTTAVFLSLFGCHGSFSKLRGTPNMRCPCQALLNPCTYLRASSISEPAAPPTPLAPSAPAP